MFKTTPAPSLDRHGAMIERERMKIVHLVNEAVTTGNGIVNSAVDLACLQSMLGHDVSYISSGGGYIGLLEQHNVRHHEVCQYPGRVLELLRDLPRLAHILKSLQPDIVHAHMMTGAVLMRLGRAFAGFGDFGLVTTIHNEWRPASYLMRLGDRVIVLSENGKTTFRKRGFSNHTLRVVPHGILHSPRRMSEAQDDEGSPVVPQCAPLIVTMAGLYRRKGIGDLIQAFGQIAEEFPEASLLVLGWGPERALFERQKASVTGGDRIHLLGFVEKPRAILRQATVFVLASHKESFPLSIAEAREAGCAIVAGSPNCSSMGKPASWSHRMTRAP
jgi:glycosyltransferase involved in cell wall biosynthesis